MPLEPSPPRSKLAVVGEKTLVPITVAIAALCFGYGWRGHEADKDASVSKQIGELTATVELAKAEIISKLELVTSQLVNAQRDVQEVKQTALTKAQFDSYMQLVEAINQGHFIAPARPK